MLRPFLGIAAIGKWRFPVVGDWKGLRDTERRSYERPGPQSPCGRAQPLWADSVMAFSGELPGSLAGGTEAFVCPLRPKTFGELSKYILKRPFLVCCSSEGCREDGFDPRDTGEPQRHRGFREGAKVCF